MTNYKMIVCVQSGITEKMDLCPTENWTIQMNDDSHQILAINLFFQRSILLSVTDPKNK